MILKKVGYYKELPYGDSNNQSMLDSIHREIDHKKEICDYLRNGYVLAACGGVVHDVIDPENGIVGCPDSLTDGVWTWHADLVYYVEKYDLLLDNVFLDHIRSNLWKVPENITIDIDNIEIM